ncbi:Mobile element protein [Dehalobacter sp. UNSWDHB]|nr:Mobile element protein [Dehalobacter sp. UNSWDHB]
MVWKSYMNVVAGWMCIKRVSQPASSRKEIRTFATMTRNLIELVDWIKSSRCSHVAMESTGDYWKPIYNLLEPENLHPMVSMRSI